MAKWFAYLTMAVIVVMYIERKVFVRCCRCGGDRTAGVSRVIKADFSETIPQTGKVMADGNLIVQIDQLYKSRITTGLGATGNINDTPIRLRIFSIDSTIVEGRFSVTMQLADTVMPLPPGKEVRLRIELSETIHAILIPVSGFYKDTGGKWIYVKASEKHFVRRNIKLGPKNPEYFVVLEGLAPGEEVLTSSYENFPDKKEVSVWEWEISRPISLM